QFLLALVVILLPALLMGGVFPLTMRIYAGGMDRVGRDVGVAYAANTVGAIVGSFLAGFVVLPLAGLQRGICAAAGLDLLLGAALFLCAELPAGRGPPPPAAPPPGVLAGGVAPAPP